MKEKASNFFILLLIIFIAACCEQSIKGVPAAVQKRFAELYPNAEDIEWDKEEFGYEANFELDDAEMAVIFDVEGNVLETETEIGKDALPAAIKSTIEKDFTGFNIDEAAKIEKQGKITYEAELEKGKEKFKATFDADGALLEKTEKKEENEEEKQVEDKSDWIKDFDAEPDDFATVGANDFFMLKPGYQLTLEGKEDEEDVLLVITVLNETKNVDGFETRIVEERESKNGNLVEISRNYFVINKEDRDVYYFGEEVDIYKHGKVVKHEGAWESGKNGARFGLMMPGKIKIGHKYYQELAPEVAMDRAEIISDSEILETPAGKFTNCLKIEETNPLEPGEKEYKIYAPGVGMVMDGSLCLVKYGFCK